MAEFRATGDDAQRMFISGKTGCGKTTVAREIARQARRCVWLDVKGLNEARWPAVVSAAEFLELEGSAARADRLDELLDSAPDQRLVVQLADRPDVRDDAQVDAAAEAVYARGNVLLVVDDAMGALSVRPPYYLARCLGMGRSRGVGVMSIVTNVHNIPRDMLPQSDHVITGETHNEDDVKRLEREGAVELGAARTLPRHEFLWYSREDGNTKRFKLLINSAVGT